MSPLKISVIVCTYNPKIEIINRCIDALKNQSLLIHEWELVIIDNNSTNNFKNNLSSEWQPNFKLIHEPKQGLTNARICGIKNAMADLILFVDDDNILENSYLKNATEIGESHPFLGAWGGQSAGEFEVPPPAWFNTKHFEMLAIRSVKKDVWSNQMFNWETTPIGAGLVVRKPVALEYVEKIKKRDALLQLDRNGSSLISGGDNDIVFTAIELGYGIGRFVNLKLEHIIPKERTTKEYIIRLTESINFSNVVLFHLYDREYNLPPKPKGRITNILNKYRFLKMPKLKKALIKAEERGVTKGKKFIQSIEKQ